MSVRRSVWAAGSVAVLGACAVPDAKPYVGSWTRTVDRIGVTHLSVEKTGRIAIRFEQPPAGSPAEMKGPGAFHGDTVTFTGASCERGSARYALALGSTGLVVTPVGTDGCAVRRQALAGTWARD